MAEYLSVIAQVRESDFVIDTLSVPCEGDLVSIRRDGLSILFTQERFAKFAADVAAFAASKVVE